MPVLLAVAYALGWVLAHALRLGWWLLRAAVVGRLAHGGGGPGPAAAGLLPLPGVAPGRPRPGRRAVRARCSPGGEGGEEPEHRTPNTAGAGQAQAGERPAGGHGDLRGHAVAHQGAGRPRPADHAHRPRRGGQVRGGVGLPAGGPGRGGLLRAGDGAAQAGAPLSARWAGRPWRRRCSGGASTSTPGGAWTGSGCATSPPGAPPGPCSRWSTPPTSTSRWWGRTASSGRRSGRPWCRRRGPCAPSGATTASSSTPSGSGWARTTTTPCCAPWAPAGS